MFMGDPWVSGVVVTSVFVQKPFYMITNLANKIMWIKVSKRVWSNQLHKSVDMKFLCFCISEDNNHEIKDNDFVDQLRLQYRMMGFSENNKWLQVCWLWGFEVSVVNAFMIYHCYQIIYNVSMQYSHYKFVKSIH